MIQSSEIDSSSSILKNDAKKIIFNKKKKFSKRSGHNQSRKLKIKFIHKKIQKIQSNLKEVNNLSSSLNSSTRTKRECVLLRDKQRLEAKQASKHTNNTKTIICKKNVTDLERKFGFKPCEVRLEMLDLSLYKSKEIFQAANKL